MHSSLKELKTCKKKPFCKTYKFTVFSNFFRIFFSEKFDKNIFFRFSKIFSEKDGLDIFESAEMKEITIVQLSSPAVHLENLTDHIYRLTVNRFIKIPYATICITSDYVSWLPD